VTFDCGFTAGAMTIKNRFILVMPTVVARGAASDGQISERERAAGGRVAERAFSAFHHAFMRAASKCNCSQKCLSPFALLEISISASVC
jgi:hypothetical protein